STRDGLRDTREIPRCGKPRAVARDGGRRRLRPAPSRRPTRGEGGGRETGAGGPLLLHVFQQLARFLGRLGVGEQADNVVVTFLGFLDQLVFVQHSRQFQFGGGDFFSLVGIVILFLGWLALAWFAAVSAFVFSFCEFVLRSFVFGFIVVSL